MSGSIFLLLCVFFSAIASIFLKMGASSINSSLNFSSLISNWMLWVGAAFYSAAFLGYIIALRQVPLSLVQPVITAGVSVVTVVAAVIFFRESMSVMNWTGLTLICLGIFFLFWGRV